MHGQQNVKICENDVADVCFPFRWLVTPAILLKDGGDITHTETKIKASNIYFDKPSILTLTKPYSPHSWTFNITLCL